MRFRIAVWRFLLTLFPSLWLGGGTSFGLPVGPDPAASCSQFMAPMKNVNGKSVGQEECLMRDRGIVGPGRKYHRVDIGVTGTLYGSIVKEGPRSNHFTSAPEFYFTQYGNYSPRYQGVLRYEAAKGTSLTLYYPETGWNGKLYIMVHGSGGSFLTGSMKPWDRYFDPEEPFEPTRFEKVMLEKGYAVARSRRNAERDAPGDYEAVLENGEVWPSQNIAEVPELIMEKAVLVKNLLKDRFGQRPNRTYLYGKSGGAMLGTLVNYRLQFDPDLNSDPDGTDTIDGFLWDDAGGGMFLPFLMRDGRDILFRSPQEKGRFIKTLEISHQEYLGIFSASTPWMMDVRNIPETVSPVFLTNKRTRAQILHKKGLDKVYRYYEVRGISHNSGDTLPENGVRRDVEVLQLTRLMDALIDRLDHWVEEGIEPPPSRADTDIGFGNHMNAIGTPETACPVGVYHGFPPSLGSGGVGSTALALFSGQGIEPVDGRMDYVDMNRNGTRDRRETMTEAWRRLGLLKPDETFSRDRYVACVQKTVETLRKEGFLTETGSALYLEEAAVKQFPSP